MRDEDSAFRTEVLVTHIAATLSAVRQEDLADVSELLTAWLEERSAGSPDTSPFTNIRDDARFWADIAMPAEIEAHVAFGLRRIERTNFAQTTLKRVFVSIWECMREQDRRRFISRVDPNGQFQKAS